ncbi:hypothetical protein NHF45_01870 [Maricaulaceae bacterium NA33B04]|nr:hypothetical protein [Maricaulaceae bacterium NA33B04]
MLLTMLLASLSLGQAQLELPPECDGDDSMACFNAASRIERETLEGEALAGMAFSRACELDYASGCFNSGLILSRVNQQIRNGAGSDIAAARLLGTSFAIATLARNNYARGCELGHIRACAQGSIAFQSGFGGEVSHPRSAEMESLGCDAGAAELCYWAGTTYSGNELGQPDYPTALSFFLRGCEGGFTNACTSARSVMVETDAYPSNAQMPQAILALEGACADEASIACVIRDSYIWLGRDLEAMPAVDTGLVRRAEARCYSQSMASWCYGLGACIPLSRWG